MDHDAAHKYIYALREVVADLLRLVIPDWVDELDLTTLEDLSSEFFDDEHRKRAGDMVWRVRFRDRNARERRAVLPPGADRVPVHGGPEHGEADARIHGSVAGAAGSPRRGEAGKGPAVGAADRGVQRERALDGAGRGVGAGAFALGAGGAGPDAVAASEVPAP